MHAFGSPAKDKKIAWREQAALTKLPELMRRVKMLEAQLQALENGNDCKRLAEPRQKFSEINQSAAANGNSSSMQLLGQVGSFSSVSFNHAAGSMPLSLAVPSKV